MKFNLKLVALLLVMLMVLTSCESALAPLLEYLPEGLISTTTTTTTTTTTKKKTTTSTTAKEDEEPEWLVSDHSMSRKDLLEMYTLTKEEVDAAMASLDTMVEVSKTAENVDEIDAVYEEFETAFYHVAEQMTIATLIYYCNTSDEEASTRYLDTQDMFYDLQDKYMQSCRTMYLESPHAAELFADWSEQDIQEMLEYDPTIVAVKKEIEELQVQYDNLDDNAYDFDDASVEIYKQLIVKNNQVAALNGYDNYYDYASKNVYGRDYTAEDLALFRQYVIQYVVPNFSKVYSDFEGWRNLSTTKQNNFREFVTGNFDAGKKNYLLMYLDSLEGTMGENMRHMFDNKNCVFSNNKNSHPTAFQTYLYESETPFCLFGSDGQSASTMVHEIGHYYAAVTNNDINNYDLCETHSQGNEFLFLKYCEGKISSSIYPYVRAYNLVNAGYVMILATIVDEFEQRVYALDDEIVASMTSEDFDAIMTDVCEPYGGVKWVTDNITDPLDYWRQVAISNPVYYISYAVSAVAAVEIYAIAEEDYDAALTYYTALVEGVTEEDGFLGALTKAGLTTPFEEETFKKIAQTFSK